MKRSISDTIEVCGFIDVADVGSPMAISRHLVLPHPTGKVEGMFIQYIILIHWVILHNLSIF
jgi:hypothetical protein